MTCFKLSCNVSTRLKNVIYDVCSHFWGHLAQSQREIDGKKLGFCNISLKNPVFCQSTQIQLKEIIGDTYLQIQLIILNSSQLALSKTLISTYISGPSLNHLFRYLCNCFLINSCCKGQLNSEWIYEVIISPKMPTKNCQDFLSTL